MAALLTIPDPANAGSQPRATSPHCLCSSRIICPGVPSMLPPFPMGSPDSHDFLHVVFFLNSYTNCHEIRRYLGQKRPLRRAPRESRDFVGPFQQQLKLTGHGTTVSHAANKKHSIRRTSSGENRLVGQAFSSFHTFTTRDDES